MTKQRHTIIAILSILFALSIHAQETPNARQARQIFDRTYNMVFGERGSSLHYAVNIIGIYKTAGNIWYKGKKSKYAESRYASWNDGTTAYMVDNKKKTVEIYRADDDSKDEYLSKFKFNADDYTYHVAKATQGYELSIKPKHSGIAGIKEVKAIIDRNYHPISMRIKVAFFWTTVKISNFKSSGIADSTFTFPRNQFKTYKFTDKR